MAAKRKTSAGRKNAATAGRSPRSSRSTKARATASAKASGSGGTRRTLGSAKPSPSRRNTVGAGIGIWDDYEDSIPSHRRSDPRADTSFAMGQSSPRRRPSGSRPRGRQPAQASRN